MLSITNNYRDLISKFNAFMTTLISPTGIYTTSISLTNDIQALRDLPSDLISPNSPFTVQDLLAETEKGLKNWLSQVKSSGKKAPIPHLSIVYQGTDNIIRSIKNPKYKLSDYISAYRKVIQYLASYVDGSIKLGLMYPTEDLAQMVASNAHFASPKVVEEVVLGNLGGQVNTKIINGTKGNPYASWYKCTYARKSNTSAAPTLNQYGLPIKTDDNTFANHAIKYALMRTLQNAPFPITLKELSDFRGFTSCHLWDGQSSNGATSRSTVYNPNFHTSLTNIVLLPSPLAGLTDHFPEISECLRLRAYDLYGHITYSAGNPIVMPGQPPTSPTVLTIYNQLKW